MHAMKIAGAAVLSLALFGTANATTNLVNDPFFTDAVPSTSKKATVFTGTGTPFGGWKVVGTSKATYNAKHPPSIDVVGGNYIPTKNFNWVPPGPGQNTVDLDGSFPGGISQTITGLTSPGNYTLTFDLSVNPFRKLSLPNTSVLVTIDGNSFLTPVTWTSSQSAMDYHHISYDFHYDGGDNVLSFFSEDSTGSTGPVIGNIDLFASSAPEPATWAMMLIGFGGLGAALRMNRRRAFATV